MSKTKEFTIKISGWVAMLAFVFSATFAGDGLAVNPGALTWVTPVADFISNIASVYAVIALLITTLIIVMVIASTDDGDNSVLSTAVAAGIKSADYDLAKAQKQLRFKPFWMTVVAVYWIFIIGAGWLWVGLAFVISGLSMQTFAAMQRRLMKEIADDEPTKEELILLVEEITKKK